ncbi:hypothetical protein ACHAXN_001332 [Cyclotella atomus]
MLALRESAGEAPKRNWESGSELSLTPHSPGNHVNFAGIDSLIVASSQSSESNASSSDASSTSSPVPKRRNAGSCAEARPTPCCSCPRTQTCSLRNNCACLSAGSVCSSCDPATCRKCRNTAERLQVLQRAAEARDREQREREQKAKNKFIKSLGAKPSHGTKSPPSQSSEITDPDSSGLGASQAEGDSKPQAKQPSTDSSNTSSESSQESEETVLPEEPKKTTKQQQREKQGDSNTSSSKGDRASASSSDHPTVGKTEGSTNGATESASQQESESANGEGTKPSTRAAFNTPPTGPRLSPRTGAPDAGSIGNCAQYNAEHNYGPHEAGYLVMEDDPKMPKQMRHADVLLCTVYGDTIHQNDGTHLDGGVANDRFWQSRWMRCVSTNLSLWDAPNGKVGKRLITQLANEWAGVREQKWNSKRPIVFCAVVLNRKTDIISASSIRNMIESRLDMWDAGCYNELVEEVCIRGKSGIAGGKDHSWKEDGEVSESVAKRYNSMVLDGKIRSAVRFATGRGIGGPLQPTDTCSKAGIPVIEVLRKKHPRIRVPKHVAEVEELEGVTEWQYHDDVAGFDVYPEGTPAALPVNFDADSMLVLSGKVHGSAGPGGVDANALRSFFTRFGTASESLRTEWAKFSEWLSNESPELCAGLEAGIEASLHAVRDVWENDDFVQPDRARPNDPYVKIAARMEEAGDYSMESFSEEELRSLPEMTAEGVALFDASNGFNELNRYCMLWNVGHRWPKGRRLAFNCYRHYNILIVRKNNGDRAYEIMGE